MGIITNTNQGAETHTDMIDEDVEDAAMYTVVEVVMEAMESVGNSNHISHPW